MGMRTCLNMLCCATSSAEWKIGWKLRSGEFADLCDKCGNENFHLTSDEIGHAFEQNKFCDEFHINAAGWRKCVNCGKRLHCGCVASVTLIELLPLGGVKCIHCATNPDANPSSSNGGERGMEQGTVLPFSPAPNTNMGMMPQLCLGSPHISDRNRRQLISRYGPRITDQELQQISGNSNCSIIPLFEKVLSASDVSRAGRLVLPKACAEAYFPALSQQEGFPITIEDVNGKDWDFQFRFWPNNESRMYVLEGVSSFIQSIQIQANDTVTFSRKEPEGKYIIGFRKASLSLTQPMNNSDGTLVGTSSKQLGSAGGKRGRKIGSKNKRLSSENEDVPDFRAELEYAQTMFRPPPNAKPTIVVIDGVEFEEYDEPPVFAKDSVFTDKPSGRVEQWVQCDSCSKWRKIPADFYLPPKWKCVDNMWDPARWFCSAPEESKPEIGDFLSICNDFEKKKAIQEQKAPEESKPENEDPLSIRDDAKKKKAKQAPKPVCRSPWLNVAVSGDKSN